MLRTLILLLFAAFFLGGSPIEASAEEGSAAKHAETNAKDAASSRTEATRLPADVSTSHRLDVEGRHLEFTATAGSLSLSDDKDAPEAEVAFIAYQLDGADAAKRPVTFAINGGPGASSAWLHLGALGPWRLPMKGLAPSSEPTLVANAETWLDFTDLVFIDPPGTGYSKIRASGDDARKRFWSVDGDIETLSVVIRRWLALNGRLASPKFIVGESYGGFRGPRLAKRLATSEGVGINGLILISPVLDFGPYVDGPDNPFPYLTRLPTYAAANREKKGPVTRADLEDVERYAVGDYLQDWLRGPRDPAAVDRMERRVEELTGLPPETVRRFGGQVGESEYLHEAERSQGKFLAFYDASIDAYNPSATRRTEFLDPVLPGFEAPFTSAIVNLYREKLGWKIDERYELLNSAVERGWSWGKGLSPPNSIDDLRQMLALDPNFRVLVSHGLTDLQTPYFATKLQLDQIPDFGAPGRLILTVHPGGHMHYSRDESRKALRDEARRLVLGQ